MICWPELNHLNTFVKIATDALMKNLYKVLLCKALLDHWELALYKYCILLLLLLSIISLSLTSKS